MCETVRGISVVVFEVVYDLQVLNFRQAVTRLLRSYILPSGSPDVTVYNGLH